MNYKNTAREIFTAAFQSVLPAQLINESVRFDGQSLRIQEHEYLIPAQSRIFIFGSGKASVAMANVLYQILSDRITGGMMLASDPGRDIGPIRVLESSHPVPTQKTLDATNQLIAAMSDLSDKDFFIYLLSGGSSAIVEKPISPITLDDFQHTTSLLLRSGAPIDEMNIVRKHLSMVKGGRLVQLSSGTGLVLVLSDVIGDDLSTIGSALLYKDDSTYQDTVTILNKYDLMQKVPANVLAVIDQGLARQIPETPKTTHSNIIHHIIGNNYTALIRAQEKANQLGLPAHIMTSRLDGEAREAAKAITAIGKEIHISGNPFSPPVCLIFGGETTVTVRGKGKGGRNQELCLSALNEFRSMAFLTILSAGTDGIDGQCDAAGTAADCETFWKAQELQLNIDEYLAANDSYNFFKKTNDLIMTGPTGTNVGDITLMIIHE
ncbi:glycerate kinase [bacterium]|nr:MAG: glycerate kinase [bacterium]